MWIFSKRRFLLSCLVMLQIFQTIIKGLYSMVISVCDELEFALKGEESTVFNRATAYSFNDRVWSTTPWQASESVDQNRYHPATAKFVISHFSPDKRNKLTNRNLVIPNVSDTFHIPANDIQERSASVKRKSDPSKLGSSDPLPVYSVLDPLDTNQVPIDPLQVPADIASDRVPNHPLQVLSDTELDQVPVDQVLADTTSDQVPVDTLQVPAGIAVDQVPMTSQSKNIGFESTPDNACSFQDATQKSSSKIVHTTLESSISKLNSSDPNSVFKLNEQDNAKSEFFEIDLSNVAKAILTQTNSKQSLKTATPYQRKMTGKRRYIIERKQAELGVKQRDKIDKTSLSVTACLTKDDIQCPKTSIQNEVHMCNKGENTEHEKVTKNRAETTTNPAAQSEKEQIALIKGTRTLTYVDYLKEIIPLICAIESKILVLCKENYKKSYLRAVDLEVADSELHELLDKANKVHTLPNEKIVLKYTFEVKVILRKLRDDVKLSMNPTNRVKILYCMKQLALSLEKARRILFDVNEECVKLGMQMEKLTASLKNKKRK